MSRENHEAYKRRGQISDTSEDREVDVDHEKFKERDREVGYEEYKHDPDKPFFPGNIDTSEVTMNSKQEDLYGTYHKITFIQKVMLVLSKDKLVVWSRKPLVDKVGATYEVTDWRRHGNAAGVKAGVRIIAIEGVGRKGEEEKSELLIYHRRYSDFARWEIALHSGDAGNYPGTDGTLWGKMTKGPVYAKRLPVNIVFDPITLLVGALTRLLGWKQPYKTELGYTLDLIKKVHSLS